MLDGALRGYDSTAGLVLFLGSAIKYINLIITIITNDGIICSPCANEQAQGLDTLFGLENPLLNSLLFLFTEILPFFLSDNSSVRE